MSTGAAVDGAPATEVDVHNSVGSNGNGKPNAATLLTPRFTQEEKEILYSLFHQHEEVIDIKYRKKQRCKYSVREAWENIVLEFNAHPGVSATRNLKQIQKFWLNARLRKQYPFGAATIKLDSQNQIGNTNIKDEPEFQITTTQTSDQNDQSETFEEIEMEASGGVTQMDEDPIETHDEQQQQQQHQHQHHHQQQHQQQLQVHVQHQPQNANSMQTQQISVDQISAEKLTLNDLLHFKPTRPHQREEIILQIKHPDTTPTQITLPAQQTQQHAMATITASGYNQQILSELKPQPITLTHFQPQTQQLTTQQLQQQHLVQQTQQPQLQQVKLQLHSPAQTQYSTAAPTFTCTSFNSAPTQQVTTAVNSAPTITTAGVNNVVVGESIEEKINYFRLKEAELRYKEQQLALEKKKIELNRAQEELKDMRELHRLRVEEQRMKIRVLQEEEKQLLKRQTVDGSTQ